MSKMNRRNFIGKTAVGAAAVTVIPSHVLGGNGRVAASDRINMAYIGAGKQIYTLLNGIGSCKESVAVAACDVFDSKLDTLVDACKKNNGNKNINAEVKAYHYYREILERSDVDAVVIATPDHWHAQMVVDAAKAGKDIYCEKPLALTVAEGRAMVNATRKYDRIFQTGNMQRSWRNFRHAVELVRNGYIGEITEINVNVGEPVKQCDLPTEEVPAGLDWDEWVGPSLYRGYNKILCPTDAKKGAWAWWRGYRDFGGGLITDWGAHMFDIAQWGMGMDDSGPVQLNPPTERAKTGLSYKYANGVVVNHTPWDSDSAVQFVGTEGRVEVSRSFLRTFPNEKLAKMEIKETDERVYFSDNHYQDWINSMKTRTNPICDVEVGHGTSALCNIINIAYEVQRPLLWDPKEEKFEGDDWANMMLSRPYRGKWDFTDY